MKPQPATNRPDDAPDRVASAPPSTNDLLDAVMGSAVDGIIVIDDSDHIEQVNVAVGRMFGYPTADVVGRHLGMLVSLDYEQERFVVESGASYPNTADMIGHHSGGTPFPVQFHLSEVRSGGRMLRVCVLRDRSELELAEQSLKETTERFQLRVLELEDDRDRTQQQTADLVQLADELAIAREQAETATERAEENLARIDAIVGTVAEGIVTCDEGGLIDSINPAAECLFGYKHGEAKGRSLATLIPGLDAAALAAQVEPAEGDTAAELDSLERVCLCKCGTETPIEISVGEMWIRGKRMFTCAVHDVSKRKETEKIIREMALYDPLTGLANRNLFHRSLEIAVATAERGGNRMAMVLLDLDKFKQVNDHFGHPVGDALLTEVARLLEDTVRPSDTVARLGGDEFAIILPDLKETNPVGTIAQRVIDKLSEPMTIEGCLVKTGTSIGIAFYPDDETAVEELMRKADLALYQAKSNGRGTYQLYDDAMHTEVRKHKSLVNDLRLAVVRDEFEAHYHPQFDLATGTIRGVEALARWQRPGHGLAFPDTFIPVAEASGLIKDLGEAMLRTACRQAKAWQAEGRPPWRVAVNVSVHQIQAGDLADRVQETLEETGLDPQWLELEITESALMRTEDPIDSLTRLRDLGIALAIDDFGTGYASLAQLNRHSPDDRRFRPSE